MAEGVSKKSSISFGTFGQSSSKQVKKSILNKGRQPLIPIIIDGVNVTPKPLNPLIFDTGKGLGECVKNISMSRMETQSKAQTTTQLGHNRNSEAIRKSQITRVYDDVFLESISFDDQDRIFEEREEETIKQTRRIADTINLTLNETETFFLLDYSSCTVQKGTEEADLVEEDNKTYEFLTSGKGRNRKVINVESQTVPILQKTRDTYLAKVGLSSHTTFVSNWEMFDTYNQTITSQSDEEEEKMEEKQDVHRIDVTSSSSIYKSSPEEKWCAKLFCNNNFHYAVEVIERLLSNNYYNQKQKRFKNLIQKDPFREEIEYNYRLDLLWTFFNERIEGKCVTAIEWNLVNSDLLAVAYGIFVMKNVNTKGHVLIWNIKNPTHPERYYDFASPVTAIAFSKSQPNVLAVGLYTGSIKLIDISSRNLKVIRENSLKDSAIFDPVNKMAWIKATSSEKEDLIACFDNGKVCRFNLHPTQLKSTQIMQTFKAEGQLKGMKYSRKCYSNEFSVTRHTPATTINLHPVDESLYFIGTGEGVIHRCSLNYLNRHLDLFIAHDAAVTVFKFSPFANKLYITSGNDAAWRLWADTISEPVLETFTSSLTVVTDFDFSPSHSTIIATARDAYIYIWDMQRKIYEPQSITKNPANVDNTICLFSKDGSCLIVGDYEGNVHVYAVEDLPYPAFFQENQLLQNVLKCLSTNPEMAQKLKKLGPLNYTEEECQSYFK